MTGLAGTDLILLMLVLAARIPWVDHTVGQDRAITLHRRLGKPALYLILAHAILLTVGYSISDGTNVIAETIGFFGLGSDMILLRGTDQSQSYLWHEIGQIAQNTNASAFSMLGPRPRDIPTWMSAHAMNNGITLESTFPHLQDSDLFICGPTAWAEEVVADARDAGLPEHRIHIERFDS